MTAPADHRAEDWLDPDPDTDDVKARVHRAWAKLRDHETEGGVKPAEHVPALDSPDMERFAAALAHVLEDEQGGRTDDDPTPEDIRQAFLSSARDDSPAMLNDTIRGRIPPDGFAVDKPDVGARMRTFIRQASPTDLADDVLLLELAARLHRKATALPWGELRRSARTSFETSRIDDFLAGAFKALPAPSISDRIKRLARSLVSWKAGPELAIIDRDSTDPTKGRVHFKSDWERWDVSYHQDGSTLLLIVISDAAPRRMIRAMAEGGDVRIFSQDMLQAFRQDALSTKNAILTLREAIAGDQGDRESFVHH
jgi:hypothetical protein